MCNSDTALSNLGHGESRAGGIIQRRAEVRKKKESYKESYKEGKKSNVNIDRKEIQGKKKKQRKERE
jgi:hypothetical protein